MDYSSKKMSGSLYVDTFERVRELPIELIGSE